MKYIFTIFLFNCSIVSYGQIADSLSFFADVMRNAENGNHRDWAAKNFYRKLTFELGRSSSNEVLEGRSFNKWVSVLKPEDQSLSLYSWQVDNGESIRYYGLIKLETGEVIQLKQEDINYSDSEYDEMTPNQWPGALYYDIISFKKGYYIILGFNASQDNFNLKVADVLHYENDQVIFGAPVFQMDNDPVRPNLKNRIVLQYSKKSSARMAFDEDNGTLYYDNLIPLETMEGKNEISWVPDGSYNGFILKKGKWIYKEKLFNTTVDTPPGEGKQEIQKRDILGRPVK